MDCFSKLSFNSHSSTNCHGQYLTFFSFFCFCFVGPVKPSVRLIRHQQTGGWSIVLHAPNTRLKRAVGWWNIAYVVQDTFGRAKTWVKELQRQASPNIVIALAGNKADLANKRMVEFEVGTPWVHSLENLIRSGRSGYTSCSPWFNCTNDLKIGSLAAAATLSCDWWTGSVLGLVGMVPALCDWVSWQVWSPSYISV